MMNNTDIRKSNMTERLIAMFLVICFMFSIFSGSLTAYAIETEEEAEAETAVTSEEVVEIEESEPESNAVSDEVESVEEPLDEVVLELLEETAASATANFMFESAAFADLNAALAAAEAAGGGTVIMQADSYTVSDTLTIPVGVTLLLPYGSDTSIGDYFPNSNAAPSASSNSITRPGVNTTHTLILEGATVNIIGGLILGGQFSSGSGGMGGQTCGAHSDIVMDSYSEINVMNGGILSSMGYITGNGQINVSAGTVYEPFIITDYHGGSYTDVLFMGQNICPFNSYALYNIQCDMAFDYESVLYGNGDLYAGDKHNYTTYAILAREDALFTVGSYTDVTFTYDDDYAINDTNPIPDCFGIGRTTMTIGGDKIASVTLGSMTVAVEYDVTSVVVNTGRVVFPIPYNFKIVQEEGTFSFTKADAKLMPGAEMYIGKDAALEIDTALYVYDGYDRHFDELTYPSAEQLHKAGFSERARLVIDGELIINDNATFMGTVETNGNTGKITVGDNVTLSGKVQEGALIGDTGAISACSWNSKTMYDLAAKIGNKAGGYLNLAAGHTYYAADGDEANTISSFDYYTYTGEKGNAVENVTTYHYSSAETVYGHWAENFKITLDTNADGALLSGNVSVLELDPYTESITVSEPVFLKMPDNCELVEWNTRADGNGETVTFPCEFYREDLTIYAIWDKQKYTITLNPVGGTVSNDTVKVIYGEAYPELPDAERDGYLFAGWVLSDNTPVENVEAYTPECGTTLYATWTPISYYVAFDGNGATSGAMDTIQMTYDVSKTLNLSDAGFVRPNWNLVGWTDEAGKTYKYSDGEVVLNNLTTENGETVTLMALWEGKPTTYTVRFYLKTPGKDSSEAASFYLKDSRIDDGTAGQMTDPDVRTYEHYVPMEIEQKEIAEDGSTIVDIYYDCEQVYVTFMSNGEEYAKVSVDYSATVARPDAPSGYTFLGCYTDEACSQSYVFSKLVTEDRTLYLKWDPIAYTIRFFDGETELEELQVTQDYETAVSAPEDPEKAGYQFSGWYTDADELYTFTTMPLNGIDLYAKWTANNDTAYSVKYYEMGTDGRYPEEGSPSDMDEQTGVTGEIVSVEPVVPAGFELDHAKSVLSGKISGDGSLVLKVYLQRKQFTLCTVVDDVTEEKTFYYGESIAVADPEKTGYSFTGWEETLPATMPAENLTVTAQWEINQYTITFVNTGDTMIEPIKQDYGTEVTAPADPEKEGHTFTGWDKTIPATMPAENLTITAQWTINQYTITFADTGDTVIAPIEQDYGTKVTAPADPEKKGYAFTSWDKAIPATMPAEDLTITAGWEINQYTISFANTGDSTIEPIKQDYGTKVTAPADPEKKGYTFTGWDKAIPETMPAENVVITGSFTANTYKVVFHANDGSGTMAEQSFTYNVEQALLANMYEMEGYVFSGWSTVENGSFAYKDAHIVSDLTTEANGIVDLYAIWKPGERTRYTIEHYWQNIGDDAYTLHETEEAYGATESETTAVAKTYEGFTKQSFAQETIAANGTTIVRINYNRNAHTLTFKNGSTVVLEDSDVRFGTEIKAPENAPTKTGYTLKWNVELDGLTMPDENLTILAEWLPNTDTVYTVETHIMNTDGTTYTIETQTFADETEKTVTVTPVDMAGFTVNVQKSILAGEIAADGSTVLHVYYDRISYKTVWDVDGDCTEVYYLYGETIQVIEAPQKTGYAFAGWENWTEGMTMPIDDVTFTANWTPNQNTKYTVETYIMGADGKYACDIQEYEGTTDDTVIITPTPDTGFAVNANKSLLKAKIKADGTLILSVYYDRISYSVSWDINGGEIVSGAAYTESSALYGAVITAPKVVRSGYNFTGWTPTIPEAMPAQAQSFTAQWELGTATYTVRHLRQDLNGEYTIAEDEIMTGTTDGYTAAARKTYTGFKAVSMERKKIEANGSTVVNVRYDRNSYTLTVSYNDGITTDTANTYQYEQPIEITDPTRTGYRFTGWTVTGAESLPATMPAAKVKLTANWEALKYGITYHLDGGTNAAENPTEYTILSDLITLKEPVKEGYTFVGWTGTDLSEATKVVSIASGSTGDKEHTANWQVNTYTILFDANGGTGAMEELTATYGKYETLTQNAFTRAGYTFDQWNTTKDGTGTSYANRADIYNLLTEGSMTLFAQWNANTYEVTFNGNGGTGAMEKQVFTYGDDAAVLSANKYSKQGYVFSGWNTAQNGTGTSYEADAALGAVLGNLNLYAQWTPITYTVLFESGFAEGEGSGSMSAQTMTYGESTALTQNTFTRTGYMFNGWKVKDGVTPYTDEEVVSNLCDTQDAVITLVAQWTIQKYQVTFVYGNGTADSVSAQNFGSDIKAPAEPVYAGYRFEGWLDSNGDVVSFPVSMPAANIAFTAKWTSYLTLLTDINSADFSDVDVLMLARSYYALLNEEQLTNYANTSHKSALLTAIRDYSYAQLKADVEAAIVPTNAILNKTEEVAVLKIAEDDDGVVEIRMDNRDYAAAGLLSIDFLTELFGKDEIQSIHFPVLVGYVDRANEPLTPYGEGAASMKQMELMLRIAFVALRDVVETDDYSAFVSWLKENREITIGAMDGKHVDVVLNAETVEGVTYTINYRLEFYTLHHDVIWDSGYEGAEATTVTYAEGDVITVPEEPVREFYTFAGWQDFTTGTKMGRQNETYVANWTANQYKVYWDVDGVKTEQSYAYGETIVPPTDPVKEGHAFDGWDGFTSGMTMVGQDMTFTAKWKAGAYSVTWNVDGVTSTVAYNYGDTIEKHADPAKEGNAFAGWSGYTDGMTMGAANLTFTAQWTINQYHIYFYDGEKLLDTITLDYGAAVTGPADPVKEGYIFSGWDAEIPETMPAKDVVIKAKWNVIAYNLVYLVDGTVYQTKTLNYGAGISLIDTPEKTGYTFSGWQGYTNGMTMPAQDVTITGTFTANTYTVSFDLSYEAAPATDGITVTYDSTYGALPVPERTGYMFAGWKLGEAVVTAETQVETARDHTLTAQWMAKTFTVTLNANGGQCDVGSITITYDMSYAALPIPTRTGYDFVGWFDGATQYNAETKVALTADQTLTASWKAAGDTPYTVYHYQQNVDGNGYTLVDTDDSTGATNSEVSATQKIYKGFALNVEVSTASGIIAADGSLKLHLYYDRQTYEILWKIGSREVRETYRYGAALKEPDTSWTDDYATYTFTGWDAKLPAAVTQAATYTAQYHLSYEAAILTSGTGTVGKTYRTLKLALQNAESGSVVRLEQDVTLDEDLTVPEGVTLVLPCVDSDPGYLYKSSSKTDFNQDGTALDGREGVGPNAYQYRLLTVPKGRTLTIYGRVMVNSVSGRPATSNYDQDVTGGYAQIDLDGEIVVKNGGTLESFGYIRGAGLVTAENGGTVGDLYLVRNWRGGNLALNMYQVNVYPMNQADCRNIEADIRINYGGTYTGLVKMYADGDYYYTRFPQVDVTNGLIRPTNEDGYVLRSFVIDPAIVNAPDREVYEIHGGAEFANSALNILGEDVTSADFIYPIDGDMDFILADGKYVFKNDFKFLTGVTMTVKGDASLEVATEAYESNGDGISSVTFYDVFEDKPNTGDTTYPNLPTATVTLEDGATFTNAGAFAGTILTRGNNVFGTDDAVWTTQNREANGYATSKPYFVRINVSLTMQSEEYTWRYGDTSVGEGAGNIIWYEKGLIGMNAACSTVSGGSVTISIETFNTTATDENCRLVAAAYNTLGQQLAVEMREMYTVASGASVWDTIALETSEKPALIRVFLLNEDYMPVTTAAEPTVK